MKRTLLSMMGAIIALSASALTYNVTVPEGTNACYIAGSMNGWTHQEMNKVDDTHYTIEIAEATEADEYKYCSGPDWKYEELKADGSGMDNRKYSANDVVAQWAAVYGETVVTGITYNVTVPEGTNACYIAGTMNGWTHQEMTKVDDTHYKIEMPEATSADLYKYCSGPSWDYVELQANGGGVNNRKYSANDVVAKWSAVYTPAGGGGEEPEKGLTYNVTVPAGTNECYIAGAMDDWGQFLKMTKVDDTHYTLYIDYATTADEYRYLSGPSWDYVEVDEYGNETVGVNRTYSENDVVAGWKSVYDPNAGGSGEEPEKGLTYNVTVPEGTLACYIIGEVTGADWTTFVEMTKVDDTHYTIYLAEATATQQYKYCSGPTWDYVEKDANGENVGNRTYSENDVVANWAAIFNPNGGLTYNVTVPEGTFECYIAGEMTSWAHIPMTMVDATHYTITIETATIDDTYKYCSGPDWAYEEIIAGNRTYSANDVVAAWAMVYNPNVAVGDISFTVTVPEGTTECYIVGSFQGWDTLNGIPMIDNGDGTFSCTVTEVTDISYKYHNGKDWEKYEGNRSASITTTTTVVDVVSEWENLSGIVDVVKTDDVTVYGTAGKINVTADKAGALNIYNAQGMLVVVVNYEAGNTTVALPRGIYLTNGTKVLVY